MGNVFCDFVVVFLLFLAGKVMLLFQPRQRYKTSCLQLTHFQLYSVYCTYGDKRRYVHPNQQEITKKAWWNRTLFDMWIVEQGIYRLTISVLVCWLVDKNVLAGLTLSSSFLLLSMSHFIWKKYNVVVGLSLLPYVCDKWSIYTLTTSVGRRLWVEGLGEGFFAANLVCSIFFIFCTPCRVWPLGVGCRVLVLIVGCICRL